jgi:LysR substrate binding domain
LLTTIGFAQGWKQWFNAAGLKNPPPAVLEFDSMRLTLETAALGHGVALARSSYAEDLLRSRRLVALFDVRLTASDNLYVVHAPSLGPQAPIVRFRDWLLAADASRPRSSSSRGRASSKGPQGETARPRRAGPCSAIAPGHDIAGAGLPAARARGIPVNVISTASRGCDI